MQQRQTTHNDSIERRVKARELAFQAIFQYDVQACGDKGILDTFLRYNCGGDELVRKLAREWTFSAIDYFPECDEILSSVMKRWSTSALMPVERAILRLSTYHLMRCPEIPGKVVINEAIELAKKFSTENSPGFVNGILDAVLKKNNYIEPPADTVADDQDKDREV